jgi:multidrug efflux pump subunit AcrA (membrane-fusion protein)
VSPIIKLVADGRYVLKARIPEIDITDIAVGQDASIVFDARDKETFTAKVNYISPAATLISGVTYYETELTLDNPPTWLRDGLNADIEIEVKKVTATTRIPKRFIVTEDGQNYVLKLNSQNKVATSTLSVDLMGNDGFAAVSGINVGEVIVAP